MSQTAEQPNVSQPVPRPLAMLACDAVHRDPNSGKRTLLGCFSRVFCREFPATHGPTALYVALTDATGDVPLRLRLTGPDDQAPPLFEQEVVVHFEERGSTTEFDVRFESIVFPGAGEYRFQLFAGTQLLAQQRIFIAAAEEASHGPVGR